MLVLSRSIGEEIVIGKESIIIKILEVCGSQVRVGIDAPKNLSVHRREIYERIRDPEHEDNYVPKIKKEPPKEPVKRIISD